MSLALFNVNLLFMLFACNSLKMFSVHNFDNFLLSEDTSYVMALSRLSWMLSLSMQYCWLVIHALICSTYCLISLATLRQQGPPGSWSSDHFLDKVLGQCISIRATGLSSASNDFEEIVLQMGYFEYEIRCAEGRSNMPR